jgi:hypothetical protein
MNPLALILTLIPSLAKTIMGAGMIGQGNEIARNTPQPSNAISPAYQTAAATAQGQMNAPQAPGSQISRNQIGGATAAGLQAASQMSSGSEGLGVISRAIASGQQEQAKLAQNDLSYNAEGANRYFSAENTLGQAQDRQQDWQKNMYLMARDQAQKLSASGQQNMFSGVSGAGAAAAAPDFYSALAKGGVYGGGKGNFTMNDVMGWLQTLMGKSGQGGGNGIGIGSGSGISSPTGYSFQSYEGGINK